VQVILTVLRAAKQPLSRTLLHEAMNRRGLHWSDRTLANYLARLVEDGTLENDPHGRPSGYGLPQEEPATEEKTAAADGQASAATANRDERQS
jgi:hypothetical protein